MSNSKIINLKTFQITSGPSREELFDVLRLTAEKRPVSFIIENNGRQMTPIVWLHGIETANTSGELWHLKFSIEESFLMSEPARPKGLGNGTVLVPKTNQIMVTACYSTRTRKGTISVE